MRQSVCTRSHRVERSNDGSPLERRPSARCPDHSSLARGQRAAHTLQQVAHACLGSKERGTGESELAHLSDLDGRRGERLARDGLGADVRSASKVVRNEEFGVVLPNPVSRACTVRDGAREEKEWVDGGISRGEWYNPVSGLRAQGETRLWTHGLEDIVR